MSDQSVQDAKRLRLGVFGAAGRMGRAVIANSERYGLQLSAAVDTFRLGEDAGALAGLRPCGVPIARSAAATQGASERLDVIVDFSQPHAFAEACAWAEAEGCPLVSGTTAIGPDGETALVALSQKVAVLWEPNMSLGVLVLGQLIAQATRMLGPSFDLEMVEVHHRKKVDAPSGTAVRLAQAATSVRPELKSVPGRDGLVGPRQTQELGMLAVRGGDVVGDHTMHFLGDGERLELTHRATSRDVFAHGALRAAAWIAGRAAGRYQLADTIIGV
jgi:4-hydroxy-tetrahydrodipicolinate reductase